VWPNWLVMVLRPAENLGKMVACGFIGFIRRRLHLGLLGLGFFVLCGCRENMCEYPFLFLFSLLKFLPPFNCV
jgi:hypothetical protein